MRTRLLVFTLAALAGPSLGPGAAKPQTAKPSSRLFGLDKVWSMHLTIQPKAWETMQPTPMGGPFGWGRPPAREAKPPEKGEDRKQRGMFGRDYAYVKALLEIDGKTYKDVGVRFKGNFSYAASQGRLKRPLKIHLSRYVSGQNFRGLKRLTLNTNVTDATAAREGLAYRVYRDLEVPASRTAYARLTITIPGKYKREFVGLYTLVEPIDKTFLKDRFGSGKGLLVKPEGVGPVEYLGEDWAPYQQRYRPKTGAGAKAKRRLIEFTQLVQKTDDKTFAREIGNYLDVDEFLRYLAGTVVLSSMDSFIGMGHNYLLYLHPNSNKFVILPWDLDLSFGVMGGSPEELMDLSIRQPQTNHNRLVERLFADARFFAAYKKHLRKLLDKDFTWEKIKKDLAAIHAAIAPAQAMEKKAAADRREGGGRPGFGPRFGGAADLDRFVVRRVDSIKGQLAGTRKGTVVARPFGPDGFGPGGFGPAQFLVKPILDAADKNKDGKLSREEWTAAAKALFQALAKEGEKALDEKTIAAGLDRLLPGPGRRSGPHGFPMPAGQGPRLAKLLLAKAGKDRKLTEASLLAAAGKVFPEADKNKDGKLDAKELTEALNKIMPRPPLGPPGGFGFGQFLVKPIFDAVDKNKDGKLSREEVKTGARALFKVLDKEGKGELDERAVTAGLDRLLPGPRGFRGPSMWLVKPLVEKGGVRGKVTEASLVAAVGKLFAEADKNKDGKVDGKELGDILNKLMPPPRFGPGPGRPFGPPPDRRLPGPGPSDNPRRQGGQ
jgi:spore coat protein CotH/Ca2+-binding EF-hand superfamily protein